MAIEKIGILGGAFDPIHCGHLILASEAKHRLGLQKILFVPTFKSPRQEKQIYASFEQRVEMLRLAISNHDDFTISDIESRYGGLSYSVRTLELLKDEYPHHQFFFIIGADNLTQLHSWYKPQEIEMLAVIAVATRPGYHILDEYRVAKVTEFSMPLIQIAGSDIRVRVRQGQPIRFLVPSKVSDYIVKYGLYRD